MSFGQWASDYLGVPLEERFNFNPLTYFLYSGIDGAWFDPEDMSTMYQDASGTTPVTALEQPVGKWLDKSGNGNHATQSITASRPKLSARYNLLTKTENFAEAAWVKSGVAVESVSDGYKLTLTSTSQASVLQNFTVMPGLMSCAFVSVKSDTVNTISIRILRGPNTIGSLDAIPITSEFSTITIYSSFSFDGTNAAIAIHPGDRLSQTIGQSVIIKHAQLSYNLTPLPYQRVNTATDYDSVGWPKYLKFDGIDDYLNLPYMGLYANGSASIVAARDALSQTTDTYVISERSTSNVNPKYFPSRQLANAGNMDAYIVNDAAAVVVDTVGSAYGGASNAVIRSVVDSGNNIKLFKNGALAANDNYTRSGTLTLTNTTIGASVSTTTSNYANMKLYGLAITKSALSDSERRRVERLLAYNSGVQI